MACGVGFLALEFVFQNFMNTWSWMGYAYTFSFSSQPMQLLTVMTKIGTEVYHIYEKG